MLWIFFTIAAATIQAFRNLEQKFLNQKLDTLTVTWSRFLLPLPAAIIAVLWSFSLVGNQFIFHCTITAFFQIAGNFLLLRTIQSKNFSIGIAFYKTEILQSLLLGVALFGQHISSTGLVAILITASGMFLMSNISVRKFEFDKAAIFGALSGTCFSVSAFNLKFASDQIDLLGYNNYAAAALTLAWVIALQNSIFLVIKSSQKTLHQDLKNLFNSENRSSFFKMGALSFMGSLLWFTAFAIGEVIYVKAVGQIELIAALLISWYLKEKHKPREFIGIFVTAIGILTLIFFH
jgi:drug/metabolite transporter (DMT)-like permease